MVVEFFANLTGYLILVMLVYFGLLMIGETVRAVWVRWQETHD